VKIGIFFLTFLLAFSPLTMLSLGDTTIEDSSFPADEGDFYKWICTYSHPLYTDMEEGSWWNITIEKIYQGYYMAIPNALIVNATLGTYHKNLNYHSSDNVPVYLVYNKTLNFMETDYFPIVPIPLNLTFVLKFAELKTGLNCSIEGNTLIIDWGSGAKQKYNYNSKGITTSFIQEINYTKYLEHTLVSASVQEISYGRYYIVAGIISIAIISIFLKKRFKIKW
jgi:hypothetical protein